MTDETNHYGATSARPAAVRVATSGPASTTIDMHSHVMVPEAASLVQPYIDLSAVPLAHFATRTPRR